MIELQNSFKIEFLLPVNSSRIELEIMPNLKVKHSNVSLFVREKF